MSIEFVFVGLGNPGMEYRWTRHNIGFLFLDFLQNKHSTGETWTKKFLSECLVVEILAKKVLLVKPQTFMNLSGKAVLQIMSFYKIKLENIFVFHDDIDLDFCRIKTKIGGSAAGHNGLKSIDEMCGKNYQRFRIGVGRHPFMDVSDFVLSKFEKQEAESLENIFEEVCSLVKEKI